MNYSLEVSRLTIGQWPIQVVEFAQAGRSLSIPVVGLIGNSVPTSKSGKERTTAWKLAVGQTVKAARGAEPWNPNKSYAITLGFSFHPGFHGNQRLDIENFMKPTFDAIAAGLFCPQDTKLATLERWAFDDSNFQHLFIHRLPDATSSRSEGAAIHISVR